MNWLIYDRQTWDIEGFGDTKEEALAMALRVAFVPGDMGLESWEAADLSLDASVYCEIWIAATQDRYRDAFEEHVLAVHQSPDAKYGEVVED